MEKSDASICTSKVLDKSGSVKIGSSLTATLRPLNAFWHFSLQSHSLFLFNNSISGAALVEYPIMNLR